MKSTFRSPSSLTGRPARHKAGRSPHPIAVARGQSGVGAATAACWVATPTGRTALVR